MSETRPRTSQGEEKVEEEPSQSTEEAKRTFCSILSKGFTLGIDEEYEEVFKSYSGKKKLLDFRIYLKELWTTFTVVNALLLASSMQPFTIYVDPGKLADSDYNWKTGLLGACWAVALIMNAIGLATSCINLGYMLSLPPDEEIIQTYIDHYTSYADIARPAYWTLLGTSFFLTALIIQVVVVNGYAIYRAGWGYIASILISFFVLLIGVVKCISQQNQEKKRVMAVASCGDLTKQTNQSG